MKPVFPVCLVDTAKRQYQNSHLLLLLDHRRFDHLLSHKSDFLKNKQKTEDIKLLYEETEEFLRDKMPSFDTFIEILGRLYINGFEICDSEMQTYGWGVYLGVR